MYNKMSFGENLINLRRQKGWSQDDLANNLNISRQAISKWETDISKPDVDNLERISKIFSVTIDNLLDNDLPNDKAVALDVKKKEKKEKNLAAPQICPSGDAFENDGPVDLMELYYQQMGEW